MPRSSSFTWPSSHRKTFPGVRSRCTTPCAWACASPRDVETDAQRFAKRDRTELQPASERVAVEQLQYEIRPEFGPPHVVDGHDVRMGQSRRGLGLAEPVFGHVGPVPREHRLERHGAPQIAVLRLVNDAKPAATDLADEPRNAR